MEKAGRHNGCVCTNIGQMNRSLHTMLQVWITTSPLLMPHNQYTNQHEV